MARADVLKKLLQSYQSGDHTAFKKAVELLIEDERKKSHPVLARELEVIMSGRDPRERISDKMYAFLPEGEIDKSLIDIKRPSISLEELVLEDTIRDYLHRILDEFRNWEILESHGLAPARRLVFFGPPGCGKSATAEAIASELSLPLLHIRLDAAVSSFLGETSANLRRAFEVAQRGQWVILLDEFDIIGRSRDDPTEQGEIKRVVNSVLQILDSFRGRSIVIATTNFESSLDWAVWRRFDDILRFPLPTPTQLYRYLVLRLDRQVDTPSDLVLLAEELEGLSFADAERVTMDIKRQMVMDGRRKSNRRDFNISIERLRYRRSILERADSAEYPRVDKD